MKKRILSLLLAISLFMSLLCTGASAIPIIQTYSGTCGDHLTWTLETWTGLLTISGTGDMEEWEDLSDVSWAHYRDYITNVVIEPGITSISPRAFEWCSGLTSVVIPDTVTSIGSYAFYDCGSLKSISIPDSVTSIGAYAFRDTGYYNNSANWIDKGLYVGNHLVSAKASNTEKFTIREGTRTIAGGTFYNSFSLTTVTFPDSLISIGDWAFKGCNMLSSVVIPDGTLSIGFYAFQDCTRLTSVTLPDSVSSIGADAFLNTGYYNDSKNWNGEVLYIGNHLLSAKQNLSGSYAIREGTRTIGGCAFYECIGLTQVTFPDSITSIGSSAFYDTGLYINSENWEDNVLYIGNHLISARSSLSGSYTVRKGTKTIAENAFMNCKDLVSVVIPDTVHFISRNAFHHCNSLKKILILNPQCNIYPNAQTLGFWGGSTVFSHFDSVPHAHATTFGYKFYELCKCPDYACDYSTEIDVLPTCTEAGTFFHICSKCGYSYPETIAPIGHSYVLTESVAPTCDWTGIDIYTCNNCGNTRTETFPATGHNFDTGKITTPATCTEPGVRTFTCTGCGSTKTESIPKKGHSFDEGSVTTPACTEPGVRTFTCIDCGMEETETIPPTGHSFDAGTVTTQAGCTEPGVRTYTCNNCGLTQTESIPPKGHRYSLYRNNGADHSVRCIGCTGMYSEPHSFVDGVCACSAVSEISYIVDETIQFLHSLNLASDISISYVVSASLLESYDSYYLECIIPVYEGSLRTGTKVLTIQPELRGAYYYFVLNGLTAIEMNNTVNSVLYLTKNGVKYISNPDLYSIATYAYNQLNTPGKPDALRAVCANLLQYGTKAQLWKGYRTDALPDAAMTEEHRSYLTDPDSVVFGNHNRNLSDLSNPTVIIAGKAINLDSKIMVRFIISPANYSGTVEDLSLHVSYLNGAGEYQTAILTHPSLYDETRNYYAFDFDGLLATELRTVMSAAVYHGDRQFSSTVEYSMDSYGNGKTGSLATLIKAMLAYSDTAKAYFTN